MRTSKLKPQVWITCPLKSLGVAISSVCGLRTRMKSMRLPVPLFGVNKAHPHAGSQSPRVSTLQPCFRNIVIPIPSACIKLSPCKWSAAGMGRWKEARKKDHWSISPSALCKQPRSGRWSCTHVAKFDSLGPSSAELQGKKRKGRRNTREETGVLLRNWNHHDVQKYIFLIL